MEIKQIGNNIIRTLNDIGNHTTDTVKGVTNFAKTKIAENKDSFEFTNKLKENNITKETAIGAGVITAAIILAVKCLKGINSSVKSLNGKN